MKEDILKPEMSFRDMFIAYLEASETGLFESGNFFITDNDFQLLLKKVLCNLKQSPSDYSKEMKRLWALCIRELVFRYAVKYNELWISLQKGFGIEVRKILQDNDIARQIDSECLSKLYSDDDDIELRHKDTKWQKLQIFCYENNGDGALECFFGRDIFENKDYHFLNFKNLDNKRYIRFLLKISVLPANYFPDNGIYHSLRKAYKDSLRPYWSEEKTEDLFQNKLTNLLGGEPDWKIHENTLAAFGKRMLEYFTLVLSWRRCGYSESDAECELKNAFDFISLNPSRTHYLVQFLRDEYVYCDAQSLPSDEDSKDSRLDCLKKMLQIDCRLSRESQQFYFRTSRDMGIYSPVVEYVSIVSGEKQLIEQSKNHRSPIVICSSQNKRLATISINGRLIADGETLPFRNKNLLKLISQEKLNFTIGCENVSNVANPWHRGHLWFLQNAFGEPSNAWNISNKAYIVYPAEYGTLNYESSGLQQKDISFCDVESYKSGMQIYCLSPNESFSQETITFVTANSQRIQMDVRDPAYIRCVSKFDGTPYFVQQNLHSKVAFGRIEFHCPDSGCTEDRQNGIHVSIHDNLLVIENESERVVVLDNTTPLIGSVKQYFPVNYSFPRVYLYPNSAYIWVTKEDNSLMGHCKLPLQREDFAIYGDHDCIVIADNGNISPCSKENFGRQSVFKLVEPEWNGLLANRDCSSNQLGKTSSWFIPDPSFADIYFHWCEGNLAFEVILSPEERKKMEEMGEFKGLAGIYRELKINGARLTCGWQFENRKFCKEFTQANDYECPERSLKLKAMTDKARAAGDYLKNSILSRKEIAAKCDEVCNVERQIDRNFTISPETFESVEDVENFVSDFRAHKACLDCYSDIAKFFKADGAEISLWDGISPIYVSYPASWDEIRTITEGIRYKFLCFRKYDRYVYRLVPNEEFVHSRITCVTYAERTVEIEMPEIIKVHRVGDTPEDSIVGFGSVSLQNVQNEEMFNNIPGIETANSANGTILKNVTRELILIPKKLISINGGVLECPLIVIFPSDVKLYTVKLKQNTFAILEGDIEGLDVPWRRSEELGGYIKKLPGESTKLKIVDGCSVTLPQFDMNHVDVYFANRLSEIQFDRVYFRGGECTYENMYPEVIGRGLCSILNNLPIETRAFVFVGKAGHEYLHAQFMNFNTMNLSRENESIDAITTRLYDSHTIPKLSVQKEILEYGAKIGIESVSLLQEILVANIRYENKDQYIKEFFKALLKNERLAKSEKNAINMLSEDVSILFNMTFYQATLMGFMKGGVNPEHFEHVFNDLRYRADISLIDAYYEGFARAKRLRCAKTTPRASIRNIVDSYANALEWSDEKKRIQELAKLREPRLNGNWTLVSFPFEKEVPFENIVTISKCFETLDLEQQQSRTSIGPINPKSVLKFDTSNAPKIDIKRSDPKKVSGEVSTRSSWLSRLPKATLTHEPKI